MRLGFVLDISKENAWRLYSQPSSIAFVARKSEYAGREKKGVALGEAPLQGYLINYFFQLVNFGLFSYFQVILMGPLRLILALHLYYYDRIVMKGMQKREVNKKTN